MTMMLRFCYDFKGWVIYYMMIYILSSCQKEVCQTFCASNMQVSMSVIGCQRNSPKKLPKHAVHVACPRIPESFFIASTCFHTTQHRERVLLSPPAKRPWRRPSAGWNRWCFCSSPPRQKWHLHCSTTNLLRDERSQTAELERNGQA